MKLKTSLFLSGAMLAVGWAAPAAAQEAIGAPEGSAVTVQDIVVTAERRSTAIQRTPLQITAITAEKLAQQPTTDLLQLSQRQPEVVFTQRLGILQTSIRGVGGDDNSLGTDPRVAFHVNGVYVARGSAQTGGLFDIERLEIVQGPQGTLYGRNATGGAINVITAAPTDDFSGYITQTIGNYSLFKTEAAVGGPMAEGFSLRLAGQLVERGGFGEQVITHDDLNDQSSRAARLSARWESGPVQVDLVTDYYKRDDSGYAAHYMGWIQNLATPNPPSFIALGGIAPADPFDNSGEFRQSYYARNYGGSLSIQVDLSDNMSVRSLTGYRDSDYEFINDGDGTNIPASGGASRETSETFSQELQLSGDFDTTKFTLGFYAFDENLFSKAHVAGTTALPIAPLFLLRGLPVPPPTDFNALSFGDAHLNTRAYAIFSQITQNITDHFQVTLGGRYSWERKTVRRALQGLLVPGTPLPTFDNIWSYDIPDALYQPERSEAWAGFTPRVTLQYQFSPSVMAYATYAKGFKSGAFGLADYNPPVDPEKLDDLEGGIKTTLFGGRLRANLSAFHYKYTDMQLSVLSGFGVETKNAARSTVYGGQFDLQANISDRLQLSASGVLLHSKLDEFSSANPNYPYLGVQDLAGNELTRSPNYRMSFAADYSVPLAGGDLAFHVQSTSTGKYYLSLFNVPETTIPAFTNIDASISYSLDNGIRASLWMNNITDKVVPVFINSGNTVIGNALLAQYSDPRTFGFTIGYRW